MKQNVFRIFSLFAILIIACSMISRFVEDWMTPRVIEVSAKEQGSSSVIDAHAIREDMDGLMAYGIIERQGVQPGLFSERNPVLFCDVNGSQAVTSLYAGQKYVLYSTKPVWNNQEIIPIKKQTVIEDQYLLIFSEGEIAGFKQLKACGFTDIEMSGNTVRVRDPNAKMPFMEDQLLAKLADNGLRVRKAYSMHEAQLMRSAVPSLVTVGILLLSLLVLWGMHCGANKKSKKITAIAVLMFIVLGFVGLYLALQAVNLPSSLLPERHIFEIQHYSEVFEQIY